jgi:hypothetical protein
MDNMGGMAEVLVSSTPVSHLSIITRYDLVACRDWVLGSVPARMGIETGTILLTIFLKKLDSLTGS